MDFSLEYTKEQEEFAGEVRAWIAENMPEGLAQPRDPQKMTYERWQERREFGRKLGEKGWLYPGAPRRYGGGGLDVDHCQVLHDEFTKQGLPLPPYYDVGENLAAPAIRACGTEEQKNRMLPSIYTGQVVTWQLFTEPEAGTDEANQQTNALRHHREGEYFVINGQKIFVGGLHAPPDWLLLLTRCDLEAPRHENLAMFVAPADLPGITIQPLKLFPSGQFFQACSVEMMRAPGAKHSVFLDDVRIHESYCIGGEGGGWRATMATLTAEHGDWDSDEGEGGGGQVVPHNFLAEKLANQYKNNPNVTRRLKENPHLIERAVDIHIALQIERLLTMRNAWFANSGRKAPYAGPQLQAYMKELGNRLTSEIADVLGPYTFTDDAELGLDESFFEIVQRSGLLTAPGGTPEALKIVISRALAIGR